MKARVSLKYFVSYYSLLSFCFYVFIFISQNFFLCLGKSSTWWNIQVLGFIKEYHINLSPVLNPLFNKNACFQLLVLSIRLHHHLVTNALKAYLFWLKQYQQLYLCIYLFCPLPHTNPTILLDALLFTYFRVPSSGSLSSVSIKILVSSNFLMAIISINFLILCLAYNHQI